MATLPLDQYVGVLSPFGLTIEKIKDFIIGAQNYRNGVIAISDGFLYGLEMVPGPPLTFSVTVKPSVRNDIAYSTSVSLHSEAQFSSSCLCDAKNHTHAKCKHVAALLLALYSLQQHPLATAWPPYFSRASFKIFKGCETSYTAIQAGIDLTYPKLLRRLLDPAPPSLLALVEKAREPEKQTKPIFNATLTSPVRVPLSNEIKDLGKRAPFSQ